MTPQISLLKLNNFRSTTFRVQPGQKLHNLEQAVEFVNQRGFIFFWPNKGVILPSLWTAVAGDRPVPDAHDDPGHVTWGWKDKSLGKRFWYYGRVLSNRNAMISLDLLQFFYALSPNYGSPSEDYLEQYAAGLLTSEAKSVYEALLDKGALDTLDLRRAAHMTSVESDGRFNKAITTLQMEFKILPVGISQAGAWKYAFIYDLTSRHYPDLIESSRQISELQAYRTLILRYLESVGAITISQVARLFKWPVDRTRKTIIDLRDQGLLEYPVEIENTIGEHLALKLLVYNE
jgi:hypothetical protein